LARNERLSLQDGRKTGHRELRVVDSDSESAITHPPLLAGDFSEVLRAQ